MKNLKIAPRYAKAIFDLARERKSLDQVNDDLSGLAQLMDQTPELSEFLKNPTVPIEKQKKVIQELLSHRVENLTLTFLYFLAERKRISQLDLVCAAFKKYYSQLRGILHVKLISAHPLNHEQVQRITRKLNAAFQKEIDPVAGRLSAPLPAPYSCQKV